MMIKMIIKSDPVILKWDILADQAGYACQTKKKQKERLEADRRRRDTVSSCSIRLFTSERLADRKFRVGCPNVSECLVTADNASALWSIA